MPCWASLGAGRRAPPTALGVESKRSARKQGLLGGHGRPRATPKRPKSGPVFMPANGDIHRAGMNSEI